MFNFSGDRTHWLTPWIRTWINSYCSGKYKLGFSDSFLGLDWILKLKILLVFRHVTDQILKNKNGNLLYDVHRKRGWGFLKFIKCLRIPFFLNNRFVHFCGWWKRGRGGHLLAIFCGRHKWLTSKAVII